MKSYADRMRAFRGEKSTAASPRKSCKRVKVRRVVKKRVRLCRNKKTGKFVKLAKRSVRGRERDKRGHFISASRKKPRKRTAAREIYAKKNPIKKRRSLTKNSRPGIVTKSARRLKRNRRTPKRLFAATPERSSMARKRKRRSRRKSVAAKRRPRSAKGRFVKGGAHETPRRKRRRSSRRRKARETASHEAAPRRRRRRARRRSVAREWSGHPRRHARAAKKGWRRRRARRSGAKRRSHRRSHARKGTHRKRSARRCRPVRRGKRIADVHGYLAAEYALENPLSGGEMAFVFIVGGFGFAAADILGRYLSTGAIASGQSATGIPTGAATSNDAAVLAFPSWKVIGAKAGMAALPGIGSYFAKQPVVRASLQGFMIGAGINLVSDLIKGAAAKWLANSALGQRLYLPEIEARQTALQATVAAPKDLTVGMAFVAAAPPGNGSISLSGPPRRFVDMGPRAGRHGLGFSAINLPPTGGGGTPTGGGGGSEGGGGGGGSEGGGGGGRPPPVPKPPIYIPPTGGDGGGGGYIPPPLPPLPFPPPPVYGTNCPPSQSSNPSNPGCAPCTSGDNLQRTYRTAMADASNCNGLGLKPSQIFPDDSRD